MFTSPGLEIQGVWLLKGYTHIEYLVVIMFYYISNFLTILKFYPKQRLLHLLLIVQTLPLFSRKFISKIYFYALPILLPTKVDTELQ